MFCASRNIPNAAATLPMRLPPGILSPIVLPGRRFVFMPEYFCSALRLSSIVIPDVIDVGSMTLAESSITSSVFGSTSYIVS